jgi:hypothetical protein
VRFRSLIMAPVNGVSRLARRVFARDAWRLLTLPRSRFDYAGEVGDGTGSSTITAPLFWMARTFPEAPPALWKKNPDSGLADQEEPIRDHPLLRLLERPNLIAEGSNRPAYSGVVLWMATIIDWLVNGNAYWIILRNNAGAPSELWFTPSWMIEPRGNPEDLTVYLDHYRYTVDGRQTKISPDQVVHFRFGLDPLNERLGMSPLKSVLREVFTDDEAANFTATLLRNMGVPGVVIAPDAEGVSISRDRRAAQGEFYGEVLRRSARRADDFHFQDEDPDLRVLTGGAHPARIAPNPGGAHDRGHGRTGDRRRARRRTRPLDVHEHGRGARGGLRVGDHPDPAHPRRGRPLAVAQPVRG